ncbi:hypothetical protein JB92DRAFT_2832490 [Gautieria morchelliformis]|nr:hypothetical protein JB92DRAFT_2832490 [Gautieria morchelliformis]
MAATCPRLRVPLHRIGDEDMLQVRVHKLLFTPRADSVEKWSLAKSSQEHGRITTYAVSGGCTSSTWKGAARKQRHCLAYQSTTNATREKVIVASIVHHATVPRQLLVLLPRSVAGLGLGLECNNGAGTMMRGRGWSMQIASSSTIGVQVRCNWGHTGLDLCNKDNGGSQGELHTG